MLKQTVVLSGSSAVGKTAVLRALLPLLRRTGRGLALCKMDCLHTEDGQVYRQMGLPCVVGLSGDICPDHFLVSNLPELWQWAGGLEAEYLFIETAGLCHRCSPATASMTAGCVLDCTASCRAAKKLGPMLSQADFVVLTKIDMVSQAELEIICWQIRQLNGRAELFPIDGLAGYGVDLLAQWILDRPDCPPLDEDVLRHAMPSGVCSYCVGEQRVGSAYQQGVVGKMDFGGGQP